MAHKKTIQEVMKPSVEVIAPEASLRDAAQKMDEADVGALPVCENDRLVGIITDRDIVVRSVTAGQDPNHARVVEAMTQPILYCFEDQEIDEVARLMEEKQVRRMPVLSRRKRLVGIVTMTDLAVSGHDEKLAGEILGRVAHGRKEAA